MKKMMILTVMMVMTISANAMSYNAAKHEALFLSDKMAYELNLTAAQYEAVYEINLDYLMSLNGHGDVFGIWWDRRNADLRFVLNTWQFDKYMSLAYFYRPVAWKAGGWTFAVYSHYNRGHFYHAHPKVFVTYKGGNNHKHDRFYADRHLNKPAPAGHHSTPMAHHNDKPAVHHNAPAPHHNKPAVHNDKPAVHNDKPAVRHDSKPNRQIAQNVNGARSNSGHFGGRR
ncbi:MAG: hypothetical protein J6W05_10515 [Prevotella sp.]|nr:hypothetical protein [Prevotella sp.]